MYLDNFNTLGIHFRIVFLSLFDYSYERNDNPELKLKKNFNFNFFLRQNINYRSNKIYIYRESLVIANYVYPRPPARTRVRVCFSLDGDGYRSAGSMQTNCRFR